jgi:uncharacterized protein YndB with AHSA1/START domain
MKIEYHAINELTADAVKKATGKSWEQWFKELDSLGGPAKGRKEMNDLLYKKMKVDPWWCSTIVVEYEAARKVLEKDGHPKGYTICATKAIAAKPQDLFAHFSDAQKLSKWFAPSPKLDFQEGGQFSTADGNRGQFKRISPGKVIRFTWQNERSSPGEIVEVKFQPSGTKCTVMVTHERIVGRDAADGLRAAWGSALDALKALVEKK